jgi:hypothetical protein
MKYQTDDGIVLKADGPEEVVQQLHEISLAPAENDFAWMEEVAKRTFQATGKTLRWGSAADFVTDMLATGLLKELKS